VKEYDEEKVISDGATENVGAGYPKLCNGGDGDGGGANLLCASWLGMS